MRRNQAERVTMSAKSVESCSVLILVPFLVKDNLALMVARAMLGRRMDVAVAHYIDGGGHGLTEDPADDLLAAGRLFNLSRTAGDGFDELDAIVRSRGVGLVVQTGAPGAYAQLPYVKERHPSLRIADLLFNKVGHTLNHFLYEACFDAVLVESEDMRRFVAGNSSKVDPGIRLVLSGIDLEKYVPLSPFRRSETGGLVVGFLGRMSPEKNPLGFIELAERLHARIPSLTFRIYGEGHLAGQVMARAAESPLGDALRYRGYAPTPTEAMEEFDVLIVPSVLDGRPITIMEASACGVPVIGAPVGGIPEVIHEGRNGYVAAPTDVDRIADILGGWIADEHSHGQIRVSSRAVAEAEFDRRLMLDRYESVFRELLPDGC